RGPRRRDARRDAGPAVHRHRRVGARGPGPARRGRGDGAPGL
ncbi:MAG: RidA/YER057c/UK114 superfamily protein, partial [uncultured Nocardioidaceae bacterium]